MSDIELRPFPPYPPPKERVGEGIMTRVARFNRECADALEDRLRLAVELLKIAAPAAMPDEQARWLRDLKRLLASLPEGMR